MAITRHRLASRLIRLSEKLDRSRLRILLGRRLECSCGHQLNRYSWGRQGGPWLWCKVCRWAGDAVDLYASKSGGSRASVLTSLGLPVDPEAEADRILVAGYRNIVEAALSESAGAAWSTFEYRLRAFGIRSVRAGWNFPYGPAIGCVSSTWLAKFDLCAFRKDEDIKFAVVPLEAFPGFFTGLAYVETAARRVVGGSGLEFKSIHPLRSIDHPEKRLSGWIGLSSAYESAGIVPIFAQPSDWTTWTFEDSGRTIRRPALTRCSKSESIKKCLHARALSVSLRTVFVAEAGTPQAEAASRLGLRTRYSLRRRSPEDQIDLSLLSAPCNAPTSVGKPPKFGWRPDIGFTLSGLTVSMEGCQESRRIAGMVMLVDNVCSARAAVQQADAATLAVSALFCVNVAAPMFGLTPRCFELSGHPAKIRRILRKLGAAIVRPETGRLSSRVDTVCAKAMKLMPMAVLSRDPRSRFGRLADDAADRLSDGRGFLMTMRNFGIRRPHWLKVRCERIRRPPNGIECVLPAFLAWLLKQKDCQKNQTHKTLTAIYLRWLRHQKADDKKTKKKLARDNRRVELGDN